MSTLSELKKKHSSADSFIPANRLDDFSKAILQSSSSRAKGQREKDSILSAVIRSRDGHAKIRELALIVNRHAKNISLRAISLREMRGSSSYNSLQRSGVWRLFSPLGTYDNLLSHNLRAFTTPSSLPDNFLGQNSFGLSIVSTSRAKVLYQGYRPLIKMFADAKLNDYILSAAHHEAAHQLTDGYLIPNNPFSLPGSIHNLVRDKINFVDPRNNTLVFARSRIEICELISFAAGIALNPSHLPDMIHDALNSAEQQTPEYRLSFALVCRGAIKFASKINKIDEFVEIGNLANHDLMESTYKMCKFLGPQGAEYIANLFYRAARIAIISARNDYYRERAKSFPNLNTEHVG